VSRRRRHVAVPAAAALVVALSTTACSSLIDRDTAPPVGIVARSTPWAGVFTSVSLPLPVSQLTAISCPTLSSCWGTAATVTQGVPDAAAIVVTHDVGSTWAPQTIPGTAGYLSAISCRDASHCVAGGETSSALGGVGVVLTTDDGGRVWTGPPPIAGTSDITALTCLTGGRCLAVASGVLGALAVVSDDDGASWQLAGALPPGTTGGTGVSCADALHCWVTGQVGAGVDHVTGSVDYTTDFGAQWTAVPLPTGTGMLNDLSCTSSTTSSSSLPFGTTPATTSATSGPPAAPPAPPPATSTTLPPTTTTTTVPGVPGFDCTVVGTTSTALGAVRTGRGILLTTTDGGSTWTSERVPTTAASFSGLSCPAVGSCVAVGTTALPATESGLVVLTGNGADIWKKAAVLTVPQPVAAVSCPAVGHCVMAGESVSEQLDAS